MSYDFTEGGAGAYLPVIPVLPRSQLENYQNELLTAAMASSEEPEVVAAAILGLGNMHRVTGLLTSDLRPLEDLSIGLQII